MKISNANDNIKLINNTITDAKFVLNDTKPNYGIWKTLLFWILSLLIVNVILSIISHIATIYAWIEFMSYHSFFRILEVVLYIMPIIIYLICLKTIDMALKENRFLKTFVFIPIFIAISKLLFPLSYYLNINFLMALYDVIPLENIVMIFGLILLNSYFRDKKFMILIGISLLYIILYSIVKMICFTAEEITPLLLNIIIAKNYIDIINYNSLFSIATILISILIIKSTNYE